MVTIVSVPTDAVVLVDGTLVPSNLEEFRKTCMSGAEVACTLEVLNQDAESQMLSEIWQYLTREEKKNIGINLHQYLISSVFHIGERPYQIGVGPFCLDGPLNCVGGCANFNIPGSCVPDAIVCVLRFSKPDESFSAHYYKNGRGEEVCFHYSLSYSLPCYPVAVNSDYWKFYHAVAGLLIGEDVKNFNDWLFFQYLDSNIQPVDPNKIPLGTYYQMPIPVKVTVDHLIPGNGGGFGSGAPIAEWDIDKDGVIHNL